MAIPSETKTHRPARRWAASSEANGCAPQVGKTNSGAFAPILATTSRATTDQQFEICKDGTSAKKSFHSTKTHYIHLVGNVVETEFWILEDFLSDSFCIFVSGCFLNFVTGYLFPAMTMQDEVIPTSTWHHSHLGQQHGTVQHCHIRLLATCQSLDSASNIYLVRIRNI